MYYKYTNIVLLAGGLGKRLWPLSKDNLPKQFIPILSSKTSTFQLALKRSLRITSADRIIITCKYQHKAIVERQVEEISNSQYGFHIIFEESDINTATAIRNACMFLLQNNNDALTYFFPRIISLQKILLYLLVLIT